MTMLLENAKMKAGVQHLLIAKIAKCRLCTAFFSSNFYFLLLYVL